MKPDLPLRVAILDDFEIVVAGVAAVLAPFSAQVAVVELDARMPVVSEVDVILYDSFAQAQGPFVDFASLVRSSSAKVAIFSWHTSRDVVRKSLAAGADGYISKGVSAEGLVQALMRVHSGQRVTPRSMAQPEGDGFGHWPGADFGLSAREAEVLALICQGLTNEAIAEQAFIGANTLKTYIRTLYRKIDAGSRTQAVLWGIENGFGADRSRLLF